MANLPLALVVVLHLILVLLWTSGGRGQTDQGAQQRYFSAAWIPTPQPKKAPPSASLPAPSVAVSARKGRVANDPTGSQAAPTADTETVIVPVDILQPGTVPATSAPDAPDLRQMIDAARRQAGLVDRELRGGKPALLKPDPDLPIVRFQTALESAYIDRSTSMLMDAQTQPDGVIVYRFRRGGKVWCRQSGGGGPSMIERTEGAKLAGAGSGGGGGTAGTVPCPSGGGGWSPL